MAITPLPPTDQEAAKSVTEAPQQGSRLSRSAILMLAAVVIVLGSVAGIVVALHHPGVQTTRTHATASSTLPAVTPTSATVTAPNPAGAQFAEHAVPLDGAFAGYYAAHHGATQLGIAITPALAVSGGWLQVFASGALYLPDPALAGGSQPSTPASTSTSPSSVARLVQQGTADPATGVVVLPLLPLLLASGSQVTIGATGAAITYVDLRAGSAPQHRVAPPSWYRANAPTGPSGTYIPESESNGLVRGHLVPPAFWAAMNDPQLSPDGWATDFGKPLTEALSATVSGGAPGQQALVQLFERGALMQVTQPQGASSTPSAVPVGLDYLRTFGPPPTRALTGMPVWSTGGVIVRHAAGETAPAQGSLGINFPLALQAGSSWVNGALWYEASWQTPLRHGSGWIPASALSRQRLSGLTAASFDALDPSLSAYLSGIGGRVGAVVYDETRGVTYNFDETGRFIVASSVKVPIMLALYTQLEAQGRDPNANETYLLTTMIENSNNSSAQALYEEIGDAPGLTAFMAKVQISGLHATPSAWGWSTITPQAMVSLLTLLHDGKILTAAHRAQALFLMEHIQSDEQTGVGTTAPMGAVVAMKDGWVTGPDGLWVMNSSGIVTVGSETYIISVYTKQDANLSDGWAITEHVCGSVGQLLT